MNVVRVEGGKVGMCSTRLEEVAKKVSVAVVVRVRVDVAVDVAVGGNRLQISQMR
jgi:hypothetical protein